MIEALARHGHFERAAEECGDSRPVPSMQIRELEKKRAAELVERRQGATTLTALGGDVGRRASDIPAVRNLAGHANTVLTRRLRLGVTPTLAPDVSPVAPGAPAQRTGLGATSLAMTMQMAASGYGVTLVPEAAVDVEVRNERIKLLRFGDPHPKRRIGWRPTSPRPDFHAPGRVIVGALNVEPHPWPRV